MTKAKGFTLIEMLLVVQITMMMVYITSTCRLSYHTPKEQVIQEMYVYIETTRLYAIENETYHTIIFEGNSMVDDVQDLYQNKALSFEDEYEITFNSKGHILNPKTIHFTYHQQPYELIFNLGLGVYRIEEV